jgi:class 3 adenylate cyclase
MLYGAGGRAMSETRKIAAILVADIVGYSRLAGADEDRILARLRALRSDLIDPTIAVHHARVVKRTGDGSLIEFRSVVRCATPSSCARPGIFRNRCAFSGMLTAWQARRPDRKDKPVKSDFCREARLSKGPFRQPSFGCVSL